MRLRQHETYLRLTTLADLLDAGVHLALIEELEALAGVAFATFRDLSRPRMPERALDGRRDELLACHVGAGFHQSTRWRLAAPDDAPLRTLELHATLHPYTGVYVTNIDARVATSWADGHADELAALCRSWVEQAAPISLHAHDADDHGIQNCLSPTMMEAGYGADPEAVDRHGAPGRERHRGHFRFVPDWITYYGPDAVALLERDRSEGAPTPTPDPLLGGWWYRIYDRPGLAETDDARAAQARLRVELDYDRLVNKDRRVWGYWQRKQ